MFEYKMVWPTAVPEATWEEYSEFYKAFYRSITVSEYDRAHKVVVFYSEQNIPSAEDNQCINTIPPIHVLSQYYIVTHQGSTKFFTVY